MNQHQEEILTMFLIGYALLTVMFVIGVYLFGIEQTNNESFKNMTQAIALANDVDAPQIPAFGLGLAIDTSVIPTKNLYANHPLVKQTLENLQEDLWDLGFHNKKHGSFYTLHKLTMENNILYCQRNGKKVSVASVLSKECGLRNPRWMNYLVVKQYGDYQINYIPFKDYVIQKHNLAFS